MLIHQVLTPKQFKAAYFNGLVHPYIQGVLYLIKPYNTTSRSKLGQLWDEIHKKYPGMLVQENLILSEYCSRYAVSSYLFDYKAIDGRRFTVRIAGRTDVEYTVKNE